MKFGLGQLKGLVGKVVAAKETIDRVKGALERPWYPPLCTVCQAKNSPGPGPDQVTCAGRPTLGGVPICHTFTKPTGQPVPPDAIGNPGDHHGPL